MRLVPSNEPTITIEFNRDELDTLVGALIFLFSQMVDTDYHPILGVERSDALAVRDDLCAIRRRSERSAPDAP